MSCRGRQHQAFKTTLVLFVLAQGRGFLHGTRVGHFWVSPVPTPRDLCSLGVCVSTGLGVRALAIGAAHELGESHQSVKNEIIKDLKPRRQEGDLYDFGRCFRKAEAALGSR